MRRLFRLLAPGMVAVGLLVGTAGASHNADQHFKMEQVATFPKPATWSDLAFWGKHAFIGYYTGDAISQGGFRIFDISTPASPQMLRDFPCDGPQNDAILWDRNGNGVADLLLLAVDRTMANPACGAPRSAHNDPAGWEGVRVLTLSDEPANPFASIQQVKAVYTDCGAHTITAWPKEDGSGLLVYVSSYPLRPGPTCGTIAPTGSTTPPYQNTANPYDEDPGSPNSPLHGVIQVVDVPFADLAAAEELSVQPAIHYPRDPDSKFDYCERGLCAPGVLEPASIACHDIVVHVEHRMAGGACAEQGQVWEIGANGLPDAEHPMAVMDDAVSWGGTGDIPGAVDFFRRHLPERVPRRRHSAKRKRRRILLGPHGASRLCGSIATCSSTRGTRAEST